MKVFIATKNQKKLVELSRILEPMGFEVLSEKDLDKPLAEIEEKQAKISEKENERNALEEKLHSLENELSQLLSNSDSISRQIESQIRALNLLSAESADMRVAMVTADTAIEEIRGRIAP